MASFTDSKGRLWNIEIDLGCRNRAKSLIGFDMFDDNTGAFFTLSQNPVQMADLIYCICKPQADQLGITDVEFGEGLGGDAISDAYQAFETALIDFFRKAAPMRGRLLEDSLRKMQEMKPQLEEMATEKINSPAAQQMLQRQIDRAGEEMEKQLVKLSQNNSAN